MTFNKQHTTDKPVIHVVTWFYEHQPGMAIYLARLRTLESIARIHIICKSERDFARLGIDPSQGTLINVPGESHLDIPKYCWQVIRHLKRQPPSPVVLLASHLSMCSLALDEHRPTAIYWNEMPVHYFWKARFNKIKGIAPGLLRWLTYLGAKKANVVMPISEFMQHDLIKSGRSIATTPIVPMGVSGVPEEFHHEPPSPTEPIRILYSGTLTKERGQEELIEGFLLARKSGANIHLILIGLTEELKIEIENRFKKANESAALTTMSVRPHAEVMSMIRKCDVAFSMLQQQEHFQYNPPTKIFEYIACGTPVIFNRIRTLTAYLEHGKTGILAELSPNGVMEAMLWCNTNRSELRSMRPACHEESKKYSWQQVQPKFIDALTLASIIKN